MNFKSILVVGLSIATLGLSLPAHAGETEVETGAGGGNTGTVIDNQQNSATYGNGNTTNQKIKNVVKNKQKGFGGGDTGTSLTNGQGSEVVGDGNKTNQLIKNKVLNKQKTPN
jgi:hypothetical protein